MPFHRSRGVQIGARVEVGVERRERILDRLCRRGPAVESALESSGAHWPVAYPEERYAHIGEFPPLGRAVRRDPHHRVIAVAARELPEGGGVAPLGQRKLRGDEQLARLERGGVQAAEEVLRRDAALALPARDDESRAERERAGGQFRRRVGERAAAAEGAAVAYG